MNSELTTTENTVNEIHGEAFGQKLVIGFTNVYYTLWVITFYAKVENVRYIQNLSMDFAAAQNKAALMLKRGQELEIDLSLHGTEGWNFFRPLAAKRYAPNLLSFSRFAGTDMTKIDPNEKYFAGMTRVKSGWDYKTVAEYKNMSGLLWATYLNKEEETFRGLRRRVIARQCLLNAGILVKSGKRYMTPEQVKKQAIREEREAAINGHHETDKQRITVRVKKLGDHFSFDTQWGTTYIVTLVDEKNRLFKYMGSNTPDIGEEFVTIKATIKHDEYKGQQETKLQRIKI